MSAPNYTAQRNDVFVVPASGLTQITIEWQQNWSQKKGNYHTGFVPVKGKGANDQVLVFIQSEWYQDASRMASIATKVGDNYEFKFDDKARYGQKNTAGEGRFVVYHDTSRNPYQHRFMDQVLRAGGLNLAQTVAKMLGVPAGATDFAKQTIQGLVGDELRHF